MHADARVPATVELVDIAGLVRGASKGEGLGNQFLAHIREVDAIVHVVRCFEDADVTHVDGSVDPLRDIETIETELALADLDTVERRLDRVRRTAKTPARRARLRRRSSRCWRRSPRTSRAARRRATTRCRTTRAAPSATSSC